MVFIGIPIILTDFILSSFLRSFKLRARSKSCIEETLLAWSCSIEVRIVILSMFWTVSRIVKCGPYCSRSSVGSMWRKVMFGNCFIRVGSIFRGRESCLRSGLPKVRIFIEVFLLLFLNELQ